jgi:AbrB family looped-hinge helix DNA binding protein
MDMAIISAERGIIIPPEVRARHGLKPGDHIHFIDDGEQLILVRASEDPIRKAEGMLAREDGRSLTKVLLEEHARELEHLVSVEWLSGNRG